MNRSIAEIILGVIALGVLALLARWTFKFFAGWITGAIAEFRKQGFKNAAMSVAISALVVTMAAFLPLGGGLAWWTENPAWLILCAASLIFFMAG